MNKKIFYIAISSLLIGLLFIVVGVISGGVEYLRRTDIDNISDVISGKQIENNKSSKQNIDLEDFDSIDLDLNNSNFEIKKSTNGNSYIEYIEKNQNDYEILVENHMLRIIENKKYNNKVFINLNVVKDLFLNGSFNFSPNKDITLYTSKLEFDKIDIDHDFGYVKINSVKGNVFNINNSAGKVLIEDCRVKEFNISNSTGKISMKNCEGNDYVIQQSMGKVDFSNIDVKKSISIESEMGSIEGDMVYNDSKYYKVNTSKEIGKIFVDPKFLNSDRYNKEEVEIELKIEMGEIKLKAK